MLGADPQTGTKYDIFIILGEVAYLRQVQLVQRLFYSW